MCSRAWLSAKERKLMNHVTERYILSAELIKTAFNSPQKLSFLLILKTTNITKNFKLKQAFTHVRQKIRFCSFTEKTSRDTHATEATKITNATNA